MSLCAQPPDDSVAAPRIVIEEADPRDCSVVTLPPEGNVKLCDYRLVNDNISVYSSPADVYSLPSRGNLVSKLDLWASISPPRDKILELLRPDDPGKDALEAIVRSSPRRGLARPYDEDTKRFLQRALPTPSPTSLSENKETESRLSETEDRDDGPRNKQMTNPNSKKERSLADELREAEEDERSGAKIRRELLREFRKRGGGIRESLERDRLGKLALAVEDDEEYDDCGLSSAARRLDALLEESRSLHEELAGIHEDMQVLARRVARRDH